MPRFEMGNTSGPLLSAEDAPFQQDVIVVESDIDTLCGGTGQVFHTGAGWISSQQVSRPPVSMAP
jgi:hypothetical protein